MQLIKGMIENDWNYIRMKMNKFPRKVLSLRRNDFRKLINNLSLLNTEI